MLKDAACIQALRIHGGSNKAGQTPARMNTNRKSVRRVQVANRERNIQKKEFNFKHGCLRASTISAVSHSSKMTNIYP